MIILFVDKHNTTKLATIRAKEYSLLLMNNDGQVLADKITESLKIVDNNVRTTTAHDVLVEYNAITSGTTTAVTLLRDLVTHLECDDSELE